MRTLSNGTQIKEYDDYTLKELSKMDGGTIADLLNDYYKYHGKPVTLKDSLIEYEEKHRIDHW